MSDRISAQRSPTKRESAWSRLRKRILGFKAEQLYVGLRQYRLMQKLRTETDGESLYPFEQLKTVFIHIPKTAGLSISRSLFGAQTIPAHRGIQFYQAVYHRHLKNYFTFAVVRNPWDRLVSAYHFLRSGGLNAKDAYLAELHLSRYGSFDEFVCQWLTLRNIYRIQHFIPQHEYVCNFRGFIGVDFLARVERLEWDFAYILARLNLEHRVLPTMNRSDRARSYQDYYTPCSRRIVSQVYQRDISLFSYTFDRVESTP